MVLRLEGVRSCCGALCVDVVAWEEVEEEDGGRLDCGIGLKLCADAIQCCVSFPRLWSRIWTLV